MEKVLTVEEFKNMVKSEEMPILVDFFATWCGPCKMLAPILEGVEKGLAESLQVVKIDIDKCVDLAREYNIMSVPTLMLFVRGEEKWRESGFVPHDKLLSMVSPYINVSLSK